MCHYLIAVLPPRTNTARASELFTNCGFGFWQWKDERVASRLRSGEHAYATTKRHCDCGTAIGNVYPSAAPDYDGLAQAAKRRAKGWSEARIARWAAERAASSNARAVRRSRDTSEELTRWVTLVRKSFEERIWPRFGFLLYWADPKTVVAPDRPRVVARSIGPEWLRSVEQNVIYEIIGGKPGPQTAGQ